MTGPLTAVEAGGFAAGSIAGCCRWSCPRLLVPGCRLGAGEQDEDAWSSCRVCSSKAPAAQARQQPL